MHKVIPFFKRNWIHLLVITALLMLCSNEYISRVLEYTSSFQIAFCLVGLALGCLILAVAVMLFLRLIEWGFSKL
jgi:hypothetical protein